MANRVKLNQNMSVRFAHISRSLFNILFQSCQMRDSMNVKSAPLLWWAIMSTLKLPVSWNTSESFITFIFISRAVYRNPWWSKYLLRRRLYYEPDLPSKGKSWATTIYFLVSKWTGEYIHWVFLYSNWIPDPRIIGFIDLCTISNVRFFLWILFKSKASIEFLLYINTLLSKKWEIMLVANN